MGVGITDGEGGVGTISELTPGDASSTLSSAAAADSAGDDFVSPNFEACGVRVGVAGVTAGEGGAEKEETLQPGRRMP